MKLGVALNSGSSPLKTSRAFRAPFLFTSLTKPHAPPPHRLYSLLLYIMEATRSLSSRFPVNLPKKSKPTASTSALFKKSTQQLPPSINLHDARRKRDSRPTKYELTSKPHGIRKRVLKNNAMRTWEKAKLEKTQLSQRDSLSSMFSGEMRSYSLFWLSLLTPRRSDHRRPQRRPNKRPSPPRRSTILAACPHQ